MSRYLCTFSGKYGDILWSLATAKHIAEQIVHDKVDFAVMPYYESLLPLLRAQKYIDHAFIIKQWMRTNSNHGDQPWQPPVKVVGDKTEVAAFMWAAEDQDVFQINTYDRLWHLTYKAHPGISAPSMPLINFIAYQQGISFENVNPVPFLEAPDFSEECSQIELSKGNFMDVMREGRLIAYAFNEQYEVLKMQFFENLFAQASDEFEFFNVEKVRWDKACYIINQSFAFVGCRSANWVLAAGLNKPALTYEPHPARHASGNLGVVFGCPYASEFPSPITLPPVQSGQMVASVLKERYKKFNDRKPVDGVVMA